MVLGIGAATWFTWLARPDTGSRCDREPNLVVATAGPDKVLDHPAERECRRLATVELAKGMGLVLNLRKNRLVVPLGCGLPVVEWGSSE